MREAVADGFREEGYDGADCGLRWLLFRGGDGGSDGVLRIWDGENLWIGCWSGHVEEYQKKQWGIDFGERNENMKRKKKDLFVFGYSNLATFIPILELLL